MYVLVSVSLGVCLLVQGRQGECVGHFWYAFSRVSDLSGNSCECYAAWWMLLQMPAVSRVSREGMWTMLGRILDVCEMVKNS